MRNCCLAKTAWPRPARDCLFFLSGQSQFNGQPKHPMKCLFTLSSAEIVYSCYTLLAPDWYWTWIAKQITRIKSWIVAAYTDIQIFETQAYLPRVLTVQKCSKFSFLSSYFSLHFLIFINENVKQKSYDKKAWNVSFNMVYHIKQKAQIFYGSLEFENNVLELIMYARSLHSCIWLE